MSPDAQAQRVAPWSTAPARLRRNPQVAPRDRPVSYERLIPRPPDEPSRCPDSRRLGTQVGPGRRGP